MKDREPLGLLLAWLVVCAVSAVRPSDWFVWFLEVAPALLAIAILAPTYRRLRFTPLAYRLMFLHACVLALGAHYTYAHVPLGEWMREAFGLARNHYDRIGHFAQGFVPAIVAREVLVRCSPLRPGAWLFALTTCVCLAFSAFYELIEWWVAVGTGTAAVEFLGTQGDPWDTQSDMAMCLVGALVAQVALTRVHDRQLAAASAEVEAAPAPTVASVADDATSR